MNARATTFDDANLRASAARASLTRFTLWLLVETIGICTTIYFDWKGLLQPVIAAGLILRVATLGTWLMTFERALPGARKEARWASGAGVGALLISLLLVLDLIPAYFTEVGWDALVGLVLTLNLVAVPALWVHALTRSRRVIGLTARDPLETAMPLASALLFAATLPIVSPGLAPSPWLSPIAAAALTLLFGLRRVLPPVYSIIGAIAMIGAAVALHETVDARSFVAVPGALAVLLMGLAVGRSLRGHSQALGYISQALATRETPGPTGDSERATQPERLSEAEADALVDRELGLAPERRLLVEVSTSEAEAIREPFELKQVEAPIDPAQRSADAARWGVLATGTRQLGLSWLLLTVGALFTAFLGLTPIADTFIWRVVTHTALGGVFLHQARVLLSFHRRGPRSTSSLRDRATIAAALLAALAFLARSLAPATTLALLGAMGALMVWTLLALTLIQLRAYAQSITASQLEARLLALIQASLALGTVGLATVLHRVFAPGDMTWLGTPLLVGTGILALGVMLRLAYVFQDAQQRFEDQRLIIARRGAGDT